MSPPWEFFALQPCHMLFCAFQWFSILCYDLSKLFQYFSILSIAFQGFSKLFQCLFDGFQCFSGFCLMFGCVYSTLLLFIFNVFHSLSVLQWFPKPFSCFSKPVNAFDPSILINFIFLIAFECMGPLVTYY